MHNNAPPVPTISWQPDRPSALCPGAARIIDQTCLPNAEVFLELRDSQTVWQAIRQLQVRGAPAIGIAAAMGLVLAVQNLDQNSPALLQALHKAADYLATARPTAVNLFWALARMRATAQNAVSLSPPEFKERLAQEALAIFNEDLEMCRAIGRHGAVLLRDGCSVLTHCNAGGLATAGYGTALAPIYRATEEGRSVSVYADETRPLLQGARLTAWELQRSGIDVTLICDNMAAQVMREKRVDLVMVGADRIAANGDAANKIGTYGLALLAHAHRLPFYVLAPTSTFDLHSADGAAIPIEERAAAEITEGFGRRTAPAGVKVYAPAFDVTPAALIEGIICEHGIIRKAPGATGFDLQMRHET
ncbi:MAG: S-methyl-5-thioribose-1-phosphate isomerase [Kiritimatiellia bacterium]